MTPQGDERLTALVVLVPEAEPAVAAARSRLDPAAEWGVPAHITVLFPFLPLPRITEDVLGRLAVAAGSVPAFGAVLTGTRWFGEEVLWLAPEPAEPFVRLTEAVAGAFPECQPYEGQYADITPHLTVGQQAGDAGRRRLRDAAASVQERLPLAFPVNQVALLSGLRRPGTWRREHHVALGSAT